MSRHLRSPSAAGPQRRHAGSWKFLRGKAGSRWLALALLAVVVILGLAPWLFPGAKSISVAAKILVFILLVASDDLLLGYTGIVSFAHTMFFGIGAYGVAIASTRIDPGWTAVLTGTALALAVSVILSLLIGLFSLRVKAIFLP